MDDGAAMDDGVPKPGDRPRVLVDDRQDRPLDAPARRDLAALAERALAAEGVGGVELSLSFVTLGEMADLHDRYMGEPGPTDVLSFSLGEDGLRDGLLGDVVVCPDYAAEHNPDLGAELRLLVVHGVLHLLGYDHEGEDERAEMWARQERYSGVAAG
jgi:probable rRNA maturation factor